MPTLHRILIKTHHMTSRKKILAITKAAKRLSCSVILKTDSPPGIMLAEGAGALEWMEVVRKLRYKDYHLMKKEEISDGRGRLDQLGVKQGSVREFEDMKEFGAFLEGDEELLRWWRRNMGFYKGDE